MSIIGPDQDADTAKIITDSTRIIHTLESRIPIDNHPQMVPCTSDTLSYQKHVYFTAQLDEVSVTRCWNKKWPKSCQKVATTVFYSKVKVAQTVTKCLGYFQEKSVTKNNQTSHTDTAAISPLSDYITKSIAKTKIT